MWQSAACSGNDCAGFVCRRPSAGISLYFRRMKLAVLPGDGIGPEITEATLRVLAAANKRFGLDVRAVIHEVGVAALKKSGTTFPDDVMEACRVADGIML